MEKRLIDEKLTVHEHHHYEIHESKTKFVALLTTVTMVVEIIFGYLTNSMALLADGWHMSSHAFAIGLTWLAYIVSRKYSNTNKHTFKKEKLLALTGFSSAIILQVVAVIMAFESINRLLNPLKIKFEQAIYVAIIGLIVNGISAIILHHKHEQSDHNINAAYLHVLADGLTSITAIIALFAGMYFKIYSLDSISGIICSIVITKWAFDLIKNSGSELIEFSRKEI